MENLLNITNYTLTELSAAVILVNITASFVISLVIVWVYQKTHRGISYSQSFIMAMVMMAVLSTIAMMILSNNLVRALGVLGIFALIRFRTILKDTLDIGYLFFVLAMGMAIGTNNYVIAFIGTVSLSVIILILSKYNYGSAIKEGFLVTFITDKNFTVDSYKETFDKYLAYYRILQIKTQPDGDKEYYFSVKFKGKDEYDSFMNQLKSLTSIKIAELVTGKDSAEY